MSTNGTYGFVRGGVKKVTYNHSDSYPSWLGKNIVDFIKDTSIEEINKIFDKIVMVQFDSKPTQEDVAKYYQYYDPTVNGGYLGNWYALLREIQGHLEVYKGFAKVMINYDQNEKWNYIIDLDLNKLWINGVSFPLQNIPDNWEEICLH